ncbi:unnamed protein product [Cyclocybe aegerita]|uniref:Uncharacterized protein n=1 Tax=Cyclocybe aegerita TaxID=1973307 RepID=A0A8S0W4M5_CYCAE|nr:unnamed protein product [Cyclocybe aegerita]
MPDFFKECKDKANIQAHYANLCILGPSAPSSTSQISSRNASADEELILQWLSKLEEEPDNADTDDEDSSDTDSDLESSPFNSSLSRPIPGSQHNYPAPEAVSSFRGLW